MTTLTTLPDEIVSKLEDLVRINVDSAKGFEAAADCIANTDIAAMFRHDAAVRRHQARELATYVELNGEDAELTGSLKGRLHRWWIDLRGTVQDGDEHAVLAEAERGEDAIKACYEEAVESAAGTPVGHVLREQLRSVTATHDRIRDMRDAWAARK